MSFDDLSRRDPPEQNVAATPWPRNCLSYEAEVDKLFVFFDDGWPIQARFWLEWGSSELDKVYTPLVVFSCSQFRLHLASLTAG